MEWVYDVSRSFLFTLMSEKEANRFDLSFRFRGLRVFWVWEPNAMLSASRHDEVVRFSDGAF